MIKNVIFDIGNVLIDFDWDGLIEKLFPNYEQKILDRMNEAVWADGRWDRLDAGDDPEEVFDRIVEYAPEYEAELRSIFRNIGHTLKKRESTPAWLKELKSQGYKIYYLSNYSEYTMKANPEVLDFLPLMDGGVFSCDVKLIKPDIKIYEAITKKYNLIPSECVFIDDLERNVKAAGNFGFHAIQCVTVKQAKEDLKKILEAK